MDKISNLSDPILCHILSFLPIHLSARTSVVAKRWRYVWTYVPDLRLIDEGFFQNKMDFPDMVDRFLLLHNCSIDTFTVRLTDDYVADNRIQAWVTAAVARDVRVLSLFVIYRVRLPQCCFECKTLVEMTLEDCSIESEAGEVCLPGLKKLRLLWNCYVNDESLPNLLSGCPALEDLLIETDWCVEKNCCYVRSPTIKSLVLRFVLPCIPEYHDCQHKLLLDTPAVQYLEIHDCFSQSQIIVPQNLSSLVEGQVCFSWDLFFELLDSTFSIGTTKFHNLIKLEIEADWYILLTELLQSAYNLESLTVLKVKDELKRWREPKQLPKCLLSSLKYVVIHGFEGGDDELNMIRYILRHAKVLQRMDINSVSHGEDAKILEQVSYSSRASQMCRLTFVSDV
ncbi:F-box/FBD/LRR-repeat protein At5g56420-like isoform X2 [Henckelia pumila]|uniref:F-box/FBD/LRR-repeat protein At5g56420-like isoform X2 n=1 Tax=Henckelia pumila TaxID=405737 RepID=UPI003C6E4335